MYYLLITFLIRLIIKFNLQSLNNIKPLYPIDLKFTSAIEMMIVFIKLMKFMHIDCSLINKCCILIVSEFTHIKILYQQ